jgi:SWI/SNF-related matrix-associated actin-dependent regulator of chromatin subfamily A-like protein 1
MVLTPRPYQIVGRDFLASRGVALLADEMRVGKTPQAILAAHKAGARSVLVTCQAIGVAHWEAEFRRWWPGSVMPRLAVWSYDRTRSEWQAGTKGRVDVYIPDECHFAKNSEAARTGAVYGKTGFASGAGAVWALSGTPAPKHAGDLWPMLRAFGAVRMVYDEFVKRYCTLNWATQKPSGTRVEMIPELRAILAGVMLRRKRSEVAPDMPDIDFQFLNVEPKGNPDIYLPLGLSDSVLLSMLENNPGYAKDDRIAVANAKVMPLADHIQFAIENDLLKQTVVFGWHIEPLRRLCGELTYRGLNVEAISGSTSLADRAIIQQKFRNGEAQVLVANILAAGTTIDLSSASHGYFLELDYVPANNVQAANRLISMEKEEKVTFDVVTWPGSDDDRVQKILLRRATELATLY